MKLPMLAIALLAAAPAAQVAMRHAAGSPDQGLPIDPARFAPYEADAAHPLNRVFALLWLQSMVPTEVAAVLPREGAPAWTTGWVHRKRAGTPADERWFGGDGRQLSLENLPTTAVTELTALLAKIRDGERHFDTPELAVLFQHDLLRAAQRLADLHQQPELVADLFRTARSCALTAAQLDALANPLGRALPGDPMRTLRSELPVEFGGTAAAEREVLRQSTRLFDAGRTLLWSRLFLAHPDGMAALTAMLPTHDQGPDVPIGMRAVLVQGIVALDADGAAHATPIVVEVRTQALRNRDGLCADNATFTHDGVDFDIWQLAREGVRRHEPELLYRHIAPDDQDLFRDYGTAKHTTYRGQCSLCHRLTDTPEAQLGGFPVLRPHAKATLAKTGDERLRLAEQQAGTWFATFAR